MKTVPLSDRIVAAMSEKPLSPAQISKIVQCVEKTAAERLAYLERHGIVSFSHVDSKGRKYYVSGKVFDADGKALRSDTAAGWLRNPVMR